MAYGRDILRKAGQSLMNFDERYADRAARDMGGAHKSGLQVGLGGTSIRSLSQGADFKDPSISDYLMAYGYLGGAMGTNLGYRYGLPAAGVTLAGQGLYNLAASMNQQTESTITPGA